jgi:hypothetical protein
MSSIPTKQDKLERFSVASKFIKVKYLSDKVKRAQLGGPLLFNVSIEM